MRLHISSVVLSLLLWQWSECMVVPQNVERQQQVFGGAEEPLGSKGPDKENAIKNANHIFNALHSSMRQWGSSLKHNGMSFFPVTIPSHTLFYHGASSPDRVNGTEWLAFEIEHAEMFARSRPGRRRNGTYGRPSPPPNPLRPPHGQDFNINNDDYPNDEIKDGESEMDHGYLHTYRTTRTLHKLLYVDGMSAGKTSMGTLDTQDRVLRGISSTPHPPGRVGDDYHRAFEMCSLGAEWGFEGILRMEAGFEIIFCNFTDGLELIHVHQRPNTQGQSARPGGGGGFEHFEYVRAMAARYHGITGGRVQTGYSQMVSAYFYDLDLSNPDTENRGLPRLSAVDDHDLRRIKADVEQMMKGIDAAGEAGLGDGINWQDVVDMIISRYSDRLQFLAMAETISSEFLSELGVLLDVFIDYAPNPANVTAALSACKSHYLSPITPITAVDHLLHVAILSVTGRICSTLFDTRSLLVEAITSAVNPDGNSGVLDEAKEKLRSLIDWLDWSTWRECGRCRYDEVCYVAMWPWGSVEDHEKPGCLKSDVLGARRGYWEFSFDV